jgi:transposase-like protein
MTLVPIKCPYCEKDVSIIIEVGETKQYICFQCSKKFTVISNIQILKNEELK